MDELDAAVIEAGDASAAVAEAARKPKDRNAPKWETEARDRLRAAVRRLSKPLADLTSASALPLSPASPSGSLDAPATAGHLIPLTGAPVPDTTRSHWPLGRTRRSWCVRPRTFSLGVLTDSKRESAPCLPLRLLEVTRGSRAPGARSPPRAAAAGLATARPLPAASTAVGGCRGWAWRWPAPGRRPVLQPPGRPQTGVATTRRRTGSGRTGDARLERYRGAGSHRRWHDCQQRRPGRLRHRLRGGSHQRRRGLLWRRRKAGPDATVAEEARLSAAHCMSWPPPSFCWRLHLAPMCCIRRCWWCCRCLLARWAVAPEVKCVLVATTGVVAAFAVGGRADPSAGRGAPPLKPGEEHMGGLCCCDSLCRGDELSVLASACWVAADGDVSDGEPPGSGA
jgi:hypothetical protein